MMAWMSLDIEMEANANGSHPLVSIQSAVVLTTNIYGIRIWGMNRCSV